jgi:predicted TIM-barrel fold metal-dependent hydrolase
MAAVTVSAIGTRGDKEQRMDGEFRIVSPDDHVIEPAHLWQSYVPARYRDVAPRVVRMRGHLRADQTFVADPDGIDADVWVYESEMTGISKTVTAAGFRIDDLRNEPMTFDAIRQGCYDPQARLADMDEAGVEASACFPNTFVRFCGQRFLHAQDEDLAKLCVEVYNEWMLDEWCGDSKGRLIPLGIIPLWDAELAAAEVERMAARGMRAFCFSELPSELGIPSIYSGHWDPFFAACQHTCSTIMMHIGSSSTSPKPSIDSPHVVTSTLMAVNSAMAMTDWLWSGVLIRYPELKIGFGECQAGWIPYFAQRADEVWEARRSWGGISELITEPPSSQIPGRVFYSFFDDDFALRNVDAVGIDGLMFEMDYPHNDTNWPRTLEVANKATEHLDATTKEKILRTNALRCFGLA